MSCLQYVLKIEIKSNTITGNQNTWKQCNPLGYQVGGVKTERETSESWLRKRKKQCAKQRSKCKYGVKSIHIELYQKWKDKTYYYMKIMLDITWNLYIRQNQIAIISQIHLFISKCMIYTSLQTKDLMTPPSFTYRRTWSEFCPSYNVDHGAHQHNGCGQQLATECCMGILSYLTIFT